MKKNYFLSFVMLLCFLALGVNANAQATSATELYGKYKFTATIQTTEYGQAYASSLKTESEVVITTSENAYYSTQITGFAGGTGTIYVGSFDAENQALVLTNPNGNYDAMGNSLHFTFPEGTYPYSVWPVDETHVTYNDIAWTWDAATKTLSVPDFAVVTVNYGACTAEIVAQYTNVKMVMTEAEYIEVPSIAGDWEYEPVEGYARNDSTFATTFSMSLAATDDSNREYDATITMGDFEPFTLHGTFDGAMLTIPFDNVFLGEENKYYFGVGSSATAKQGAFTFQYQSETVLMQWDAIYVREDSVYVEVEETDETTGETVLVGKYSYPIVQKLTWGYATRENEATKGFSWVGKFNATADVMLADEEYAATFGEWPSAFDFVIEEKTPGSYYLTEFLGNNVYYANQSYCSVVIADDNKSATVDLTQYYGMFLLKSLGNGKYLQIFDGFGNASSLTFTLNDDGSITVSPIFIQETTYGGTPDTFIPVVMYENITAAKEVQKFEWLDTFTLTADVEVFDASKEWDDTFLVKFERHETWGIDLLTEFLNCTNVTNLTYGANSLAISEDTQSAEYACMGNYIGGSYPLYYYIYDKNESTTALKFTVNADGTVSMDDFVIYVMDYNTFETVKGAKYTNVVLTRGIATGIESVVEEGTTVVEGIFDLMGRQYDEITVPGIYIVNGKKVVVK